MEGGEMDAEVGGWHCGDAVRGEIPGCSSVERDAHFADVVADTAGGARVAFSSSFCRWGGFADTTGDGLITWFGISVDAFFGLVYILH
jgi:hypothetical protein